MKFDCIDKMIHWELYKRLKLDYYWQMVHTQTKMYPKEEVHKILWDFEIQTENLISTGRSDLMLINKKRTYYPVNFAVTEDHNKKKKYNFEYSDYWPHLYCYTVNVLVDISFGLLQVFYVELGSLYRISNWTLYLIRGGRLFQCLLTMTRYKC